MPTWTLEEGHRVQLHHSIRSRSARRLGFNFVRLRCEGRPSHQVSQHPSTAAKASAAAAVSTSQARMQPRPPAHPPHTGSSRSLATAAITQSMASTSYQPHLNAAAPPSFAPPPHPLYAPHRCLLASGCHHHVLVVRAYTQFIPAGFAFSATQARTRAAGQSLRHARCCHGICSRGGRPARASRC